MAAYTCQNTNLAACGLDSSFMALVVEMYGGGAVNDRRMVGSVVQVYLVLAVWVGDLKNGQFAL